MNFSYEDIGNFLGKLKDLVLRDEYTIYPTEKNNLLDLQYVISEERKKNILLSLEPDDFSEIRISNDEFFNGDILYIFGKEVPLLERYSSNNNISEVELYIKMDYLKEQTVCVVSFHKAEQPMEYAFKEVNSNE